jgi:hypothetical protein
MRSSPEIPPNIFRIAGTAARAETGAVAYGRCVITEVVAVPIFLIERRFAEDLEGSAEVTDRINRINEEEGVRWLYSFLAADKRKTYCLYEAPDADAIRRAADRAGLPANAVVEVIDRLLPDGSLAGSPVG